MKRNKSIVKAELARLGHARIKIRQTSPYSISAKFGPKLKRSAKNELAGMGDMDFLKKGFFGQFARNPIGTLVGLVLFFITLDWLADPTLSPMAGSGLDFPSEMAMIYNNSNWILVFAFAVLPVAIAYAFMAGELQLPHRGQTVPEPRDGEEAEIAEQEDGLKDQEAGSDFDGT